MKKFFVRAAVVLICVLIIPAIILTAGFCTAPQFSHTYYGELGAMYGKLKKTEGKKIIIIGTSGVAFGVDSALIESELRAAGAEYTVCNFGLYGAIGTKVMLDLSEDCVKKGDVIIFTPELDTQTLSLYYSAKEIWRAADGNFDILGGIAKENVPETVGNFVAFTAEKFKYASEGGVKTDGVYARASFDSNCDMKNADRSRNIMPSGYNPDLPVELTGKVFDGEFLNYINEYAAYVRGKGAEIYFSYPPMNRLAVSDCSERTLESFYGFLSENLDFRVISNAEKYIMDCEWFYDTNYHLNSAGMTVRSINLLEDIKNELGIFTRTQAEMPEKPPLGGNDADADPTQGNNSCADFFGYRDDGSGNLIAASLTEEGKKRERITVPYSYGGKKVTGIDAGTFSGNGNLREVIIQSNISYLRDGSFSGCNGLEKIILLHTAPSRIGVGYGLLEGTGAVVCVPESAFSAFNMDYTWGWYAERLVSYEI